MALITPFLVELRLYAESSRFHTPQVSPAAFLFKFMNVMLSEVKHLYANTRDPSLSLRVTCLENQP